MTLTEFLLARIAEDESVAKGRVRLGSPPGITYEAWQRGTARALAECEAKRSIVSEHTGPYQCSTCYDGDDYDEGPEGDTTSYAVMKPWPCPTIRAIATIYADHPDYDKAWRAPKPWG